MTEDIKEDQPKNKNKKKIRTEAKKFGLNYRSMRKKLFIVMRSESLFLSHLLFFFFFAKAKRSSFLFQFSVSLVLIFTKLK